MYLKKKLLWEVAMESKKAKRDSIGVVLAIVLIILLALFA